MTTYRKKLIEVDLPLDDINHESARDASLTHGHPSTLHRYWSRKPLATCRALIFASMVDDPCDCEEFYTPEEQAKERERLHKIIRRLVVWKNSNDENLLAEARYEIARSIARNNGKKAPTKPDAVLEYLSKHCPSVYDPFCGAGSILLETQRLGLHAIGSDLNPLSVLLTKTMVELPLPFHNKQPVNPDADPMDIPGRTGKGQAHVSWRGNAGLASDIRYYGAWMKKEARTRIGHLYPKAHLPDGTSATVVAWLWARTIPCPNPACGFHMPMLTTFQLCKKKGNEHWTKPIFDRKSKTLSFVVQTHNEGVPQGGTIKRTNAYCCNCGTAVKLPYVREQGKAGKIEEVMTAIVAEGERGKLFLSPTDEHIQVALSAESNSPPKGKLPKRALGFAVQNYGFTQWHQLFTKRQLTILETLSNLLLEVHDHLIEKGAQDKYADVVCTYLALAIGRTAESGCSFAWWENSATFVAPTFTRQALQMNWGFAEANPFSNSTQNWMAQIDWVAKVVERLPTLANSSNVYQADAATTDATDGPIVVTDPPYYDNIGYADLSDFFYVWLRPLLRDIYPELFGGIVTPKNEEITASPRFEDATQHFEELLDKALLRLRQYCSYQFPSSIFYAYKQQEEERDGITSTGWETMLLAIVNAGFHIVSTWPMRTERPTGVKTKKNSLASSVVLVCRQRPTDASVASRREFLDELKEAMSPALDLFTREGHIAPVDLAQAAIGPGMEVYSRYSRVERVDGELVPVREALAYINREIDAYFEQEEGDFDAETRFCFAWLKQHDYKEGKSGEAELLAVAKAVSINSMGRLLTSGGGIVQLRSPDEYYEEVDGEEAHKVRAELPLKGITTAWEGCLHMMFHLNLEGGSTINGAAEVAEAMHNNSDCSPLSSVERLARLLYNHYDRQRNSANAVYFNNLVTSWDKIMSAMEDPKQREMF